MNHLSLMLYHTVVSVDDYRNKLKEFVKVRGTDVEKLSQRILNMVEVEWIPHLNKDYGIFIEELYRYACDNIDYNAVAIKFLKEFC